MSKPSRTVLVSVTMELSVSDDCYANRFADKDALMRYALSSCFKNHTRTIINVESAESTTPALHVLQEAT